MKRIVLTATAVAGILTAGIATVASAATMPAAAPRYVTVKETTLKPETETLHARATCKLTLTTIAPTGASTATPGIPSGDQYGAQRCGALGAGATEAQFATTDTGEVSGRIEHWFRRGSISGTFSLTQSAPSGPPTVSSFTASSYTGTLTLADGHGALKGATATGTLDYSTQDGTHWTCIEKLKVTQTVTVLKKVTVKVRVKVA